MLAGWFRDPKAVGLPIASSYWTSLRLARATLDSAIPGAGPIVELGAGTGPVTEALIEMGCAGDRLVVVERDAELCRILERRFRGLHLVHGNALEIDEVLAKAGISSVGAVLSGLPMRVVPRDAAMRCYAGAFRLMPTGGAIVQYTYGFRSPVMVDEFAWIDARFVGREWRNVPPINIWCYTCRHGDARVPTR